MSAPRNRYALLTRSEYNAAARADHGTVRRYLSGCHCERCDRPAHRRFAEAARYSKVTSTRGNGGKLTPAPKHQLDGASW